MSFTSELVLQVRYNPTVVLLLSLNNCQSQRGSKQTHYSLKSPLKNNYQTRCQYSDLSHMYSGGVGLNLVMNTKYFHLFPFLPHPSEML